MTAKSEVFWTSHLLRRAGFGANPSELKRYCKMGYDATLDELLRPESIDNTELEEHIKEQNFDFTQIDDLKRWWIYRMAFSRRPLQEKMALFWHGHFATSNRKVANAYGMYMQNMLFRNKGLGNFQQLLLAVSKDPAMIFWLDNQQNKKSRPNENYAREVMELFTLGIGNYSETDVKEAARAFTGWQALPTGFFFNERQHDFDTKTVLGVTAPLNGDDVIEILVRQKSCARFIATKLIKFFVADEPDPQMITRIAEVYTRSNYELRKVLRAIFTDPVFLSEKSYHAKIKSPAELVVGTIKTLQVTRLDGDLPVTMARMGQDLFYPPSVKGWDGGTSWIATDTMMERFNFANRITSEKFSEMDKYSTVDRMLASQGIKSGKQMVDYFLDLFIDGDAPPTAKQKLVDYVTSDIHGNPLNSLPDEQTLKAKMRGLVHLIMTLPTYQLA